MANTPIVFIFAFKGSGWLSQHVPALRLRLSPVTHYLGTNEDVIPMFNLHDRTFSFSKSTIESIQRLLDHLTATKDKQDNIRRSLENPPRSKLAAVFVLLYEKDQHLRVLLTTRGKKLKFHGGETALPGGMNEAADVDLMHTARREAFEEVALPLSSAHVHTLGTMDPFVFYNITVTPVIALLTDISLLVDLKPRPKEVDHIFTHSLEAFLDPNLAQALEANLVDQGSEYWPYEHHFHCFQDYDMKRFGLGKTVYRYHHFRSSASPITGLTADIMLQVACIVYGREPVFERWAPTQIRTYEEIVEARTRLSAQTAE